MTSPASLGFFQDDWREYDPSLYVQRAELENSIMAWMEVPTTQRILSLVGAPGVGKSWLLSRIADVVTKQKTSKTPRFVLHLSAKELLEPDNLEKITAIKFAMIDRANESCPGLNYLRDKRPPLPDIIALVRERFCIKCPFPCPLILVDDCDDIGDMEFDQLQSEFLLRFFSPGIHCFRMIIAARRYLTEPDLPNHKRLVVGVFEEPQLTLEQIVRLSENGRIKTELAALASLESLLPDYCTYSWDQPFINSFLLAHHAEGKTISSDTLVECCRCLINRPIDPTGRPMRQHPMLESDLQELIKLAALSNRWKDTDFSTLFGRDLDRTDLDRGVIQELRPYYTVADGLRELLRDLVAMREKGA